MQALTGIFVFLFGLLAGSFLNVCIYRIPLGRTIVRGRSYCPACEALIPWYCNVPLVSWLALRGRCKDCGAAIPKIYPAVEFLGGLLFLLAWLRFGLTPVALLSALVFSALLVLSVIDYRIQIIPDGIVLFLAAAGLVRALLGIFTEGAPWHLYAIGVLAAALPLFLLSLFYEDGVGGGDIKLLAAVGLFTGWKLILLALFLGALYGLLYAGFLLLRKQAVGRKTAIPFGPFLSLGIATSILVGDRLLVWYFSLLLG